MEQLIGLRASIDLLSHQEFIQFIESNGKQFWANLIFEHFSKQLQRLQNMHKLDNIIADINKMDDAITDIIRSRNKDNDDGDDDNDNEMDQGIESKMNLNTLPNEMISHISSFLGFQSMSNLEKTCRAIFIGTRTYFNCKYSINKELIISLFKPYTLNYIDIQTNKETFIPSINMLNGLLLNGIYSKQSKLKIEISYNDNEIIKQNVSEHILSLLNILNKNKSEFSLSVELMNGIYNDHIEGWLRSNKNVSLFDIDGPNIIPINPGISKRRPRDNGPRRNQSAYFIFSIEQRSVIALQRTDLKITEISKLLAAEWRAMDSTTKQIYIDRALEDKRRYEMEINKYHETESYRNFQKILNEWRESVKYQFVIKYKEYEQKHINGLCFGQCQSHNNNTCNW